MIQPNQPEYRYLYLYVYVCLSASVSVCLTIFLVLGFMCLAVCLSYCDVMVRNMACTCRANTRAEKTLRFDFWYHQDRYSEIRSPYFIYRNLSYLQTEFYYDRLHTYWSFDGVDDCCTVYNIRNQGNFIGYATTLIRIS